MIEYRKMPDGTVKEIEWPNPEPTPIDNITALQLALAELAEAQAADQTANELALAELAEIMAGG